MEFNLSIINKNVITPFPVLNYLFLPSRTSASLRLVNKNPYPEASNLIRIIIIKINKITYLCGICRFRIVRKPDSPAFSQTAVTQNGAMPNSSDRLSPNTTNHYALLGLHPSASAIEIRRAYRQLSKCYHPDTTDLPSAIATAKFQQLNEAYATLSNPERRMQYDIKIGYSRLYVVQAPPDYNRQVANMVRPSRAAYIDPTDRPLSAGEIFVLFILGLTFVGCILLAIAVGLTRGDTAFSPTALQTPTPVQEQITNFYSPPTHMGVYHF